VAQVEELQGPDSVTQTNTKQMLKSAVSENISYSLGRALEISERLGVRKAKQIKRKYDTDK